MIKKTILVFIALIAIHYVYRGLLKPDIIVSQGQWQDNQIKAQTYLYETDQAKGVIVGSSLATRLIDDSLPQIENIAFGGESAMQGLDILLEKTTYPQYVIIEVNTLFRNNSISVVEDVSLNPFLLNARKYVYILRDGTQPLPLLQNYVEKNIGYRFIPYQFKIFSRNKANKDIASNAEREQGVASQMKRDEIERAKKKGNAQLPEDIKNRIMGKLKTQIAMLEENGTRIIFMEMPIDKNLYKSTREILNTIQASFPPSKYDYITTNWADYETTDGSHMNPENGRKYTSFLKKELERIEKTIKY